MGDAAGDAVGDAVDHPATDDRDVIDAAGGRDRPSGRTPAGSAPATTGPAIAVVDVTKRYGATTVLDDVGFTIGHGEFVAVTGRSGAGKSTLLHLLAALERPDSGTITVAGHDLGHLHALTNYRRCQIGLVFQLHNLIPRLTAEQNVQLPMFGTGLDRRERRTRARRLLEQVELGDRLRSRPPAMSGGERQRVAVARALANDPGVVLADEPTGSLDDQSARVVLDLLEDLRSSAGTTVLAVTHDPRLAERADRLLDLTGGHLRRS